MAEVKEGQIVIEPRIRDYYDRLNAAYNGNTMLAQGLLDATKREGKGGIQVEKIEQKYAKGKGKVAAAAKEEEEEEIEIFTDLEQKRWEFVQNVIVKDILKTRNDVLFFKNLWDAHNKRDRLSSAKLYVIMVCRFFLPVAILEAFYDSIWTYGQTADNAVLRDSLKLSTESKFKKSETAHDVAERNSRYADMLKFQERKKKLVAAKEEEEEEEEGDSDFEAGESSEEEEESDVEEEEEKGKSPEKKPVDIPSSSSAPAPVVVKKPATAAAAVPAKEKKEQLETTRMQLENDMSMAFEDYETARKLLERWKVEKNTPVWRFVLADFGDQFDQMPQAGEPDLYTKLLTYYKQLIKQYTVEKNMRAGGTLLTTVMIFLYIENPDLKRAFTDALISEKSTAGEFITLMIQQTKEVESSGMQQKKRVVRKTKKKTNRPQCHWIGCNKDATMKCASCYKQEFCYCSREHTKLDWEKGNHRVKCSGEYHNLVME